MERITFLEWSKIVVPKVGSLTTAVSASPEHLLEMQILRCPPDLMIQKFWEQGPEIFDIRSPLSDAGA